MNVMLNGVAMRCGLINLLLGSRFLGPLGTAAGESFWVVFERIIL